MSKSMALSELILGTKNAREHPLRSKTAGFVNRRGRADLDQRDAPIMQIGATKNEGSEKLYCHLFSAQEKKRTKKRRNPLRWFAAGPKRPTQMYNSLRHSPAGGVHGKTNGRCKRMFRSIHLHSGQTLEKGRGFVHNRTERGVQDPEEGRGK